MVFAAAFFTAVPVPAEPAGQVVPEPPGQGISDSGKDESGAEGRVYFLAASVKPNTAGYTARAVRRLLSRYQTLLLQTRGMLIVATPHPGRLARTVSKHEGYVKTLKVDGSIRKVGN